MSGQRLHRIARTMLVLRDGVTVKVLRGRNGEFTNRVVIKVSAGTSLQPDGTRALGIHVYVLQDDKPKRHFAAKQGAYAATPAQHVFVSEDTTPEMAADVLEGMCDLFASLNNVAYHIENPERLQTLRAGRWSMKSKWGEGGRVRREEERL